MFCFCAFFEMKTTYSLLVKQGYCIQCRDFSLCGNVFILCQNTCRVFHLICSIHLYTKWWKWTTCYCAYHWFKCRIENEVPARFYFILPLELSFSLLFLVSFSAFLYMFVCYIYIYISENDAKIHYVMSLNSRCSRRTTSYPRLSQFFFFTDFCCATMNFNLLLCINSSIYSIF